MADGTPTQALIIAILSLVDKPPPPPELEEVGELDAAERMIVFIGRGT